MTNRLIASNIDHETHQFDHYLRANNIVEPLIYALANVNFYRPDDPIEFIATRLIDWSMKNFRQKFVANETHRILTTIEIYREQCRIDDEQKQELNQLKIQRQKKLDQDFGFEYDRYLFALNQSEFQSDPHTDDEREPLLNVQMLPLEQQYHGEHNQHLHMHETASGLNDQTTSRRCSDGLPSSTYFSKLKDRLIKCDDITN